jgi:hypothetical protein
LLLLRKSTRTRAAWAVLLPLAAVYLLLHVVEGTVNNLGTWNYTAYYCSLACEMLRSLALGLAVLLTLSDLIRVRRRFLRAVLVFSIVVFSGSIARVLNAPLFVVVQSQPPRALDALTWSIEFGVLVLVFLLGLRFITGLLRRWAPEHMLTWYAGICLLLGMTSILVMGIAKLLHDSATLLSTWKLTFFLGALPQPFLAPYLVFFWFTLLAVLSPFYRQRFANCLAGGAASSPGEQRC